MTQLIFYAVESSICLALLWGFYEVMLRKDTLHNRNRYYLLASAIISLALPLINIDIRVTGPFGATGNITTFLLPEAAISDSGAKGTALTLWSLLSFIYITGLMISGVRTISGIAGLIFKASSGSRQGRIITFDSGQRSCFSAFGYIFISTSVPPDIAVRMINHEMNHIRRMHHIDLILAGIISVIQWFNPAAIMMRRSLQAIHEYEADDVCIRHGEDPYSYQQLLLNYVLGARTPLLSNTFSHKSLLKKRIIMMTKNKTGNSASLKLLLAIPLAAMLLLVFSCNQSGSESAPEILDPKIAVYDSLLKDNVFMSVDQQPLFMDDPTSKKFIDWVYSNVTYPEQAKSLGVQGKVLVRFIIDENGKLIDPEVIKTDNPLLDEAALSALENCPDWAPARYEGKPVKAFFTLPITFMLN
ncbi:MAG: M56 family metallopeptidase [Bacteroidales bacterium]|nr:M56 family metallopeptidase [Bacteroidales bacterium]